ncbi:sigma-70 family RNA polymerase sigma factor [[Clostridium] innocuum]|nr:sigma-70 family RNA polymerase sigma factor [[Clostridium] innocuum]
MKNDYKRSDFAEITNNGERKFYIRINNNWIQVSREVFRVCKGYYKKILNDNYRDQDVLQHYEDVDTIYPFVINKREFDIVEHLYMKDLYKQLHAAFLLLSESERNIIRWIYFEELTEQEVANLLHITQPTLNYRKQKILKKLKNLL